MGSIDSRLRRLEERGRGGVCPECGFPPDSEGAIVLIDEEDRERSFQGDPDERCKRCGRALWCVIEVVHGDPRDHEEGGGDSYWPHAPE
jgi:hypothetical protein